MRPIPPGIKAEVIKKYLEGNSIPQIGKFVGVFVGRAHTITTEESRKIIVFYILEK